MRRFWNYVIVYGFTGLLMGALGDPAPPTQEPPQTPATKSANVAKKYAEVQLFLKSGDKLRGWVQKERIYEKAVGSRFILSKKEEKGSGIRIWFIGKTFSYVFFPSEIVKGYEILKVVSEEEYRQMWAQVEEKAGQSKELPPRKPEAEEKKEEGSTEEEKKEADKSKEPEKLTKEGQELLKRFPPDQGWGAEKLEKIQIKRINHIYPSKEEADFETHFKEWEQALKASQDEKKKEEAPKEEKKEPAPEPAKKS